MGTHAVSETSVSDRPHVLVGDANNAAFPTGEVGDADPALTRPLCQPHPTSRARMGSATDHAWKGQELTEEAW
jgi:hypothetical protein